MNMLLMRQEGSHTCMFVSATIAFIPLAMRRSRQRKISDGHAVQWSFHVVQLGAYRKAE